MRDDDYTLLEPSLRFIQTATYPCNYLEQQEARSLIAISPHLIGSDIYNILIQKGFRRAGFFSYRPHCPHCAACVPVRVPVSHFLPHRTQKRCLTKHGNLRVRELELAFYPEHYDLYLRYQQSRHAEGTMNNDSIEKYSNFILNSSVESRLLEFSDALGVRIVSLIDSLDEGLSAVYTFFDTRDLKASFGTYAILWQISECQRRGLSYLYLGYWIANCQKMAYKNNFQPIEGLINNRWQPLHATPHRGYTR